jgi:hypothetical protein
LYLYYTFSKSCSWRRCITSLMSKRLYPCENERYLIYSYQYTDIVVPFFLAAMNSGFTFIPRFFADYPKSTRTCLDSSWFFLIYFSSSSSPMCPLTNILLWGNLPFLILSVFKHKGVNLIRMQHLFLISGLLSRLFDLNDR